MNLQVGTGEDIKQCVGGCCCLRAVERIEMVLTQVALGLQGKVGVVQNFAVADEVVTQVAGEARRRCPREIFALVRLVELYTVDIRERVLEVEAINRMEVYARFSAEHPRITLAVLIRIVAFGFNVRQLIREDIVVDEVGKKR